MPRRTSTASSPQVLDELPAPASLRGTQAKRRQRIIDQAQAMLIERGDANVEMREIAEGAGVALGTAYRYFGSKDRLLAEVFAQWQSQRHDEIKQQTAKGKTNTDRTRLHALTAFERIFQHPRLWAVGQALRVSDDPSVLRILVQMDQRMIDQFRSTLVGIDERDAQSIAVLVTSVVTSSLDRVAAHVIGVDEAKRRIAEGVTTVLEFRDPTLDAPKPRRTPARQTRVAH